MKMSKAFVFAAALSGWLAGVACAQDPLEVAPGMYRLLFENERVRVMEVVFQPGQSIAPHSHPDHHVYVVEGGTLRISKPDGTSSDATVNAGDVLWIGAETHWAENIGTSTVRLVVSELKEHAAETAAP